MESEKQRIESIPDNNMSVVPSSAAAFNLHEFTKRVNLYQSEQQTYSTSSGDRLEVHIDPSETYLEDVAIFAKITASSGARYLDSTAALIQSVEILADNQQLVYLDNAQYYLAKKRQQMDDASQFVDHRQYYAQNRLGAEAVAANGYNRDAAWTGPADAGELNHENR